jgi:hypothetical protein
MDRPEQKNYYQVWPLHEAAPESFEEVQARAAALPKGWWELARLGTQDRIEFVRSYWQVTLPYIPHVDAAIGEFFNRLQEIEILLVKEGPTDPFVPQMIYREKGDGGFFVGLPPAPRELRSSLQEQFSDSPLPQDYVAFLKIHDGFRRASDTGLVSGPRLLAHQQEFQGLLAERDPLPHPRNPEEQVDPADLIPFYQSFGLDSFQCFYADWYPQQEMGNIYYSGIDHTLSNTADPTRWTENLAFPTFLDWLAFYLQMRAE